MFTHLSGWKSRVEIDQRAREGRLRQEWREAPHENDRVSLQVIFWSVLALVARRTRSVDLRHNRHRSLPAFASGPNVERHSPRDPATGAAEAVSITERLEPKPQPLSSSDIQAICREGPSLRLDQAEAASKLLWLRPDADNS